MRKLLVALIAGLAPLAHASLLTSGGTSSSATGAFTSSYGYVIDIGAKIKIANHPAANQTFVNLANTAGDVSDSVRCRVSSTDNNQSAVSQTSGDVVDSATAGGFVDDTWISVICTFVSSTSRAVRTEATTGTDTDTNAITEALDAIEIGSTVQNGERFVGRIAEVVIWETVGGISTESKDAYVNNECTSGIDAANQIAYWSLENGDANALVNLGSDAGGDLTLEGDAALDNDHPTIGSCGGGEFDVTPSVASQTATAYTITGSLDAAGDVYFVACAKDQTAPTGAQVAAGDCTGDVNALATDMESPSTGDFDFIAVLTLTNDFPIADLYAWDGVTLVTLADEVLDVPAGMIRCVLASVAMSSPLASTDAAAGDYLQLASITDPNAYGTFCETDGSMGYSAGGDESRQFIDGEVYDVSAEAVDLYD